MKSFARNFSAGVSGLLLSMFSALALADTSTGVAIDTAGITDQLGEVETAVMAVGGAIIVLAAIAVGFKWLKGMLFS